MIIFSANDRWDSQVLVTRTTLYHKLICKISWTIFFKNECFFFFSLSWMSNSQKVPNLVCDPRENLRKLASTSTGKKYRELAWRHLHHLVRRIIFYFMRATWKYMLHELRSRCMKPSNENKSHMYLKCILTFGSLFIADNILKAAIVTVSS